MSKIGKSLLKGARESLAYARGITKKSKAHQVKIPKKVDIRAIRSKLHMTRQEFASHFGCCN